MFSFSPGRVFVRKRERDADFFVLWIKTRKAKRFLVSPSFLVKKEKETKKFPAERVRGAFSRRETSLKTFLFFVHKNKFFIL
jgi:hypothetical protein